MMRRLQLGLVLVLVAGAQSAVPRAQNPQRPGESAPTGLLMGVVIDPLIDPLGGQPVPNAEVRLGGAPLGTPNTVVLTDGEGRFVFMALPKGSFTITATKAGYAEGARAGMPRLRTCTTTL